VLTPKPVGEVFVKAKRYRGATFYMPNLLSNCDESLVEDDGFFNRRSGCNDSALGRFMLSLKHAFT
jgi:hypothetical protein